MSMGAGGLSGLGSQQGLMSQLGLGNISLGMDGQPQGVPRGHGRRHSVNVLNKGGAQQALGSISYSNAFGQDGFDDGFAPPAAFGGHSRQASRADSSWRLSKSGRCCLRDLADAFFDFQMVASVVSNRTMLSLQTLRRLKLNCKAFSSSVQPQEDIIRRSHLSASPICYPT